MRNDQLLFAADSPRQKLTQRYRIQFFLRRCMNPYTARKVSYPALRDFAREGTQFPNDQNAGKCADNGLASKTAEWLPIRKYALADKLIRSLKFQMIDLVVNLPKSQEGN